MSGWIVSLGLAIEAGGLAALFTDLPSLLALSAYLTAHALATLLFTVVCLPLLPASYRRNLVLAGVFLFTLQFAMPVIGSIGVFAGILLPLRLPRSEHHIPWQETAIPDLPYRPVDMDEQLGFSDGGLREVLREASSSDKRLKALLASRQLADQEAVDILKEALKDPTDDIRLLAYSMLEQKEKQLATRAQKLKKLIDDPDHPDWHRLTRRLAHTWWEIAYLGLAQGGLKQYYLENARNLLADLTAAKSFHNDWRLLGRIELALGHTEAANNAFQAALASGAPPELIYPYQAEMAFLARDFQKVRFHLANCSRFGPSAPVKELMEGWL
ncbi:polysaccharide biosynthesis protein [Marinobacter sp.]|uniref:polysaccharide biosynthesis protein n=1 Tax=Marinobacter sp. TaxID=50741 RepID=UPI002B27A0CD|nr:polysaccharide biosynthesis protein [Marinobacter sp.]